MPHGTQKVKQLSIPRFLAFFLILLFIISGIGVGAVVQDYVKIRTKMPVMAQLKEENLQREKQFVHLAQRIDELTSRMCDLREFDRKLKVMVNQDTSDEGEEMKGLGGPNPILAGTGNVQDHRQLVRKMHRALDNLEDESALSEQDKSELHKLLEEQKTLLASTPSIWPTKGWLSSSFGMRVSPFTGRKEFHKGIDISTRIKSPIYAPADGIVSYVGRDRGYGKMVWLRHGNGILTKYAHLNTALVKKGQHVKRGETIALVGNTGRSTGPHLHYEVHLNGVAVNPIRYILN
jgi:murein DD-endopeptidase MepM/ murein hydrolase activator NlpD